MRCVARLGPLRGLGPPSIDVGFSWEHVCPRTLAGIADESVPLHVAYDRMWGYRHMDHARSTLRADRIGSDDISG